MSVIVLPAMSLGVNGYFYYQASSPFSLNAFLALLLCNGTMTDLGVKYEAYISLQCV